MGAILRIDSILRLEVVAADPEQAFVVRADRGVRYKRIDTVIDALRQANAREVYLLSEQEAGE